MKKLSGEVNRKSNEKEINGAIAVSGTNSSVKVHQTSSMMYILWTVVLLGGATLSDARVAGKIGIYTNNYSGKSSTGINEEIIWVSIGMGITIAILITIALCYILTEKCKKRRDYFANT